MRSLIGSPQKCVFQAQALVICMIRWTPSPSISPRLGKIIRRSGRLCAQTVDPAALGPNTRHSSVKAPLAVVAVGGTGMSCLTRRMTALDSFEKCHCLSTADVRFIFIYLFIFGLSPTKL